MGRQNKDDAKIGKYESKLNPDKRPCSEVKTRTSKMLY